MKRNCCCYNHPPSLKLIDTVYALNRIVSYRIVLCCVGESHEIITVRVGKKKPTETQNASEINYKNFIGIMFVVYILLMLFCLYFCGRCSYGF